MRSFMVPAVLVVLALRVHAGEMETRELTSEVLGQTVKLNVLLPDRYQEETARRYPTVYLLHGYGGDYEEWKRVGVADEVRGVEAVLVMPEGDKSFYINHHGDPKGRWEEYITREVVGHVDRTYRTVAAREGRAVLGLSMGGYGALMLALRHPDLFASAGSHSGALQVPEGVYPGEIAERVRRVFGPDDSSARKDYNIFRLIQDLPAEKRPHLYLDCGSRDFLLEASRKFAAHLANLKVDYEYREVPGSHDFRYWKTNVRYALDRQLGALKASTQALAAARAAGRPADVTGLWSLLLKLEDRTADYDLRIKEEGGGKLKAVLISPRSGEHPIRSIAWQGGVLRMEIERDIQGTTVTFLYEGKLEDGKLAGKVELKEFPEGKGQWTAERKTL